MFLSEDAFDLDDDGAGPRARRDDTLNPAPGGARAGHRVPSRPGSSRPGSSRPGSRPGSRGGAGSLSRPGSSRAGAPGFGEPLGSRDPPRGLDALSGARPAHGFGASRHEAPADGFGDAFAGSRSDGFHANGHDGAGRDGSGSAASVVQKARRARELAAARRKERQMGGGVVRNDVADAGFGLDGGRENPRGGGFTAVAPMSAAPPSRPMAPGGFQRPRPPSQPRPTSVGAYAHQAKTHEAAGAGETGVVRANPLFAPVAPRSRVDAEDEEFRERARRELDLDRVAPFDESGIETVTLESPGSLAARRGSGLARDGFGRGPGPTHVAARDPQSPPRRVPPAVVEISDRRVFLTQPAPRSGDPVQCHILRRPGKGGVMGIGGKRYPEYFLYLDGPGATPGRPADDAVFLLSARRRKKSTSSNYVISLDEDDLNRQSGAFFGKLRSNFVGTEFTVFDKGAKPGKVEISKDPADAAPRFGGDAGILPAGTLPPRTELGAVRYDYNVLGTKGPRIMTGAIPRVDEATGARAIFRPTDSKGKGGILEALKKKPAPDVADLVVLKNKQPRWNEQMQAYCLNFHGRVTEASVKNFQLADARDETEATILQFGKVGKDAFTMDYAFPMSALQAFAICLSSFDNKLACE